jgi:hypothetical protein
MDSLVAAGPVAVGTRAAPPGLAETVGGIVRLRSLRRVVGFGVSFPNPVSPLRRLPEVLERARHDVDGWGGQLLIAYMPAYERYHTIIGEGVPGRREFLAVTGSLGIDVIDLHEVFSGTGRPKSLWSDPRAHLSAEGYGIAAEAIASAVDAALLRATPPRPRD